MVTDLSPDAIVRAIEDNLFALFRSFKAIPHALVEDRPEFLRFYTGLPSPLFNGVARARLAPDTEIDDVVAPLRARGARFFWWTGPQTSPPDLSARLAARGIAPNWTDVPGMAADLDRLNQETRAPADLRVEAVESEAALREWGRAFTAGFEVPEWAAQAWADATRSVGFDRAPWRLYVGQLDGEPIGTAIMVLGAGVAGMYGVGTVPGARGRGIGTELTLAPLREARDLGYRVGILHSTEMGLGVYRRLGFEQYCTVARYVWLGA